MSTERTVLNADLLKKVSGEFDLASITEVNAKGLDIKDVCVISECTGLVFLDLSQNNISDVHHLESLKSLTTLNLSCNRLSSLVGLQGLESLKSLNIAGNLITSIDCLQPLVPLENLRNLRLKDAIKKLYNPVCQTVSQYKKNIISLLSQLTMLDGERLSGDVAEVFDMCDNIEQKLNDFQNEEKNCDISHINRDIKELNEKQCAVLSSSKSEAKMAWSAEQQFNDVLKQCQSLNQDAEKAISDAKEALWGSEKTTSGKDILASKKT